MSKSSGNVVDPIPLIDAFGADPLRYFLLREMAFGQDAQFSEEGLIDRINTDLANDLGNLTSRLLTLIASSTGGVLPPLPSPGGDLPEELFTLRARALGELKAFKQAFITYRFHEGLATLWSLISGINRFIVRWEPWSLAKDPARSELLGAVLREAAEGLAAVAIAVSPVMPQAAEDLWRRLGGEGTCADHDLWRRAREDRWGLLGDGRATTRGEALFPRIDKKAYFKEETMNTTSSTPGTPGTPGGPPGAEGSATPAPPAAASDQITIQDFLKVKLRTAVIRDAVKVEGADKLLKLTVDLGGETRTIVAGIALQYEPASLVGKSVVVVANLKPAKLRGVESQGMLLAADIGGKPIIATFEQEVPPGSTVR